MDAQHLTSSLLHVLRDLIHRLYDGEQGRAFLAGCGAGCQRGCPRGLTSWHGHLGMRKHAVASALHHRAVHAITSADPPDLARARLLNQDRCGTFRAGLHVLQQFLHVPCFTPAANVYNGNGDAARVASYSLLTGLQVRAPALGGAKGCWESGEALPVQLECLWVAGYAVA